MLTLFGTSAVSGFLQMPENSATPGAIYCVGTVTLIVDGEEYGFVLDDLGFVGVCPGTGVSGSATGCL
jgi:hypothetical protein